MPMTPDQTNTVLEHLRHIRGKVDEAAEEIQNLKALRAMEKRLAVIHKELSGIYKAITKRAMR